jgi:hypothetical protein
MNIDITVIMKEHMLVVAGWIMANLFRDHELELPEDEDEAMTNHVIDIVEAYIADSDPDPDDFYEYVKCKLVALYGNKSLS